MYYDIYIVKNTGTCLFHQKLYDRKERSLSADLISGFFSAIFLFTSNFVDKKIEIMEIEYLRLIFKEKEDYIFVAFVDEFESVAQVKEILAIIIEQFFQIYGELLKDWNSDIKIFEGFDKEIEMILTKEDINRMYLIEKIENFLNFDEKNEIEGIAIFTSKAELMYSNILNDQITQFLVKLIEIDSKIDSNFEQVIINRNNQYIIIEKISENLIVAILIKPNFSIDRARAVCKYLFKVLKKSVQEDI